MPILKNNEFGLFVEPEHRKIPYYSIKLTPEEVKEIEFKKINFYHCDGKTLFEVRDKDGKLTGEHMLFVIFT